MNIRCTHSLRCVDPDDVQVAEVDALLVQERGAGAALRAEEAPRGGGGGSTGGSTGGSGHDCDERSPV